MTSGLVTLVNPNKVHPPIAPYALDVLTTVLEEAGFNVHVLDVTFHPKDWRTVLAEYFTSHCPLLIGVSVRNTDTLYALEQRPFIGEHREIIDELKRLATAPIVVGGAGFSAMPFMLMDYFDVDFGVKGPGEHVLCELAESMVAGRPPEAVPGLLVRGGKEAFRAPLTQSATTTPTFSRAGWNEARVWQVRTSGGYNRRSGTRYKVDNLEYYLRGGLAGVLTKNGCPYRCSYCLEPDAKGTRFARRDVTSVVDEMESLAAQGIYDQHTTDSEFNLSIVHAKNVLREIASRRETDGSTPLRRLRLWVYCQPAPFDEELAELLARAGCRGVNVGADHVRTDLLQRWKTTERGTSWHTFDDTRRLVRLCAGRGILTMIESMLGMPGETATTMRECVEGFMDLDATVTSFSLGLRLFPYAPLGIAMAEECDGVRTAPGLQSNASDGPIVLRPMSKCATLAEYERQFMLDEAGDFRLLCYFSPQLPDDTELSGDPRRRWTRSVALLWDLVPESERYRVMLPTVATVGEYDNNYADNPLLSSLAALGYTGAFWAHWRTREKIMKEAVEEGIIVEP